MVYPHLPCPWGPLSRAPPGVWWRSSREIDVLVCPRHLFLKDCVAVHYLSPSIRSLHGVQQGGKSAGFLLIVLLYLSIQLLNSFIFCSIMQHWLWLIKNCAERKTVGLSMHLSVLFSICISAEFIKFISPLTNLSEWIKSIPFGGGWGQMLPVLIQNQQGAGHSVVSILLTDNLKFLNQIKLS